VSGNNAIEAYNKLHQWYYVPGEVVRSIGFYINPYKTYKDAQFRHCFSIDGNYNLYVAQYSIYKQHIDDIFDLKDKREYGMIYPHDSVIKPEGFEELNTKAPVVEFDFLETKNIVYLNKRFRPIGQRLYDYGLPPETYLVSRKIDLWYLTIKNVLKDKYLERPSQDNTKIISH